ncbi:MAG TPA: beta-xylosidase, partial [Bacteroidetes bacterium]|nr:beta-xylosidase [Bacteroidota bacterium]
VASYPTLKDLPVIIGECDPEGCAACSMQDYPENAYRNGTMYSSYTAASFPRIYELADHFGINLRGIVTWAFEFEGQPWFNGYRDLATNGVDKPVLNVFRMFGMMEGRRVKVTGDPAYDCFTVRDSSVRGKRDVNAFAATTEGKATVMLWNYHDLNVPGESVWVNLETTGLDTKTVRVSHYRIDRKHSNAYELWKEMGSPQEPDPSQVKELEEAGQLHLLGNPVQYRVNGESLTLPLELPGQAVSLIVLEWYD